jgi:protein involved in polysaccharide export with SLBB domain
MNPEDRLEIGDIVRITSAGLDGETGIVCKPITETSSGHVLVYSGGYIQGATVTIGEVLPADKTSEGYAQLAYSLIKLGSLVIERGLL